MADDVVLESITFRVSADVKAKLEAAAAGLEEKTSEVMRELLEDNMDTLMKRADEEVARRMSLPHGVTPDETEKALKSLLRILARGESFVFSKRELLTPKVKALWVYLSYVWGEEVDEKDREAAIRVLNRPLGEGDEPAPVPPAPKKKGK